MLALFEDTDRFSYKDMLLESHDSLVKNTAELFAFGTLQDYKATPESFIKLSPNAIQKLQMITIQSKVAALRKVTYDQLLQITDLKSDIELEVMLLDCAYKNLMDIQIYGRERVVHVKHSVARDVCDSNYHLTAVRDATSGEDLVGQLRQWRQQIAQAKHEVIRTPTIAKMEKNMERFKRRVDIAVATRAGSETPRLRQHSEDEYSDATSPIRPSDDDMSLSDSER